MTEQDLHGDVDRLVFYRDSDDQWRWRFRAAGNAEVLADSGQGYTLLEDALTAAHRVTGRRPVTARPNPTDEIQAVFER